MLTAAELHDAFMELGRRAFAEDKVIDLAVYGGSALMLASNFRVSTQDVDAVAVTDQDVIDRFAAEIAARRSWSPDWLNDGVRVYLSPQVEGIERHHELFRAYPSERAPGLRVFVPTPEYILAMKLMAMRLDPVSGKTDLTDLVKLLDIVGLDSPEATIDFAAGFYPEARVSGRLSLGVRTLWRLKEELAKEKADAPPTYLGRGGPAP
jgi:hypothetical protein